MQSNVLFINEYFGGSSPTGKLLNDLHGFLRSSGFDSNYFSLRTDYKPGGLRFSRLLNFIYFHAVLPFILLRFILTHKNPVVVSLTSPPLAHWSALIFGRIFNIPVFVWYMDAHPELEIRLFLPKLLGRFCAFLDVKILSLCRGFIALDPASKLFLETKTRGKIPTVEIPPWITYLEPGKELHLKLQKDSPLKFIYAGNFGHAHSLDLFCAVLEETALQRTKAIQITFVGMPVGDVLKVSERLKKIPSVEIKTLGRLENIQSLYDILTSHDFGIVSLTGGMEGIAVPSKAFTYLSLGLPIFYVGSDGTLAAQLCEKGWGIKCSSQNLISLDSEFISQLLRDNIGQIFSNPREESLAKLTAFLGLKY